MTTTGNPTRNGVDVATLFATVDAVRAAPQIAQFQFRASNDWVSGTHSRGTIQGFYGAMQEDTSRTTPFVLDGDPQKAIAAAEIFGDRFASEEYRRELALVVARRALASARERSDG